jgi:hypothetical protein
MGAAAGTYEHLYIWPNCNGQPTATSGGACGIGTQIDITNNSGVKLSGGHPTVRAHINHDVMVAFRSPGGNIHLVFYTPSGTLVNDFLVQSNPVYELPPVTACLSPGCSSSHAHGNVPKVGGCNSTDCDAPAGTSGTGGCMRIADKVYMTTRRVGRASQYAYLTYTHTCGSPAGDMRTKVHLDVVDVSSPTSPYILNTWVYGGCGISNDNAFEPVFVAAQNSDNFAWGFYVQNLGNPADTRFVVYPTTDPVVDSLEPGITVDSGFPTLIVNNSGGFDYGLGDYIGGADDVSGSLYFTYGRPVTTTATTCPPPMNSPTVCGGQKYSVALYGVKVTP